MTSDVGGLVLAQNGFWMIFCGDFSIFFCSRRMFFHGSIRLQRMEWTKILAKGRPKGIVSVLVLQRDRDTTEHLTIRYYTQSIFRSQTSDWISTQRNLSETVRFSGFFCILFIYKSYFASRLNWLGWLKKDKTSKRQTDICRFTMLLMAVLYVIYVCIVSYCSTVMS